MSSTVRPALSRRTARLTCSTLAGSRSAVGSSRTTSDGSPRNARARPIRRRSPGDSGRPPSPHDRRRSRSAGAPTKRVGARRAPRPRAPRAPEAGRPRLMLSATLPRTSVGCWGTHATSARQSVDPAAGEVDAADRDAAGRRLQEAEQQRRHGALAGAALPDERDGLAGRQLEVEPVEDAGRGAPDRRRRRAPGAPAPPRGSATGRGPPARAAAGASSSASIRSATARPSALAWYSAPSRRRGRYSSGASTSTVSPAWRPRPPSASRTPTVTATSATPRVAASSSTVPERKVRRSVPIVARRWRSLTSAMRARLRGAAIERAQRRQAAHDVEEVRRQAAQGVPALAGALLGGAADEPHEDRHERQRDRHDERRLEVDGRPPTPRRRTGRSRRARPAAGSGRSTPRAPRSPAPRPRRSRRTASRRPRSAASPAGARRAPGAARRARSPPRAGPRPPSPTPARRGPRRRAPARPRRVAARSPARPRRPRRRSARAASPGAATNAVVTTPSAVSAISSGRTDRVRRTRRGSRARHGRSARRRAGRRRGRRGSTGAAAGGSPPRRARKTW